MIPPEFSTSLKLPPAAWARRRWRKTADRLSGFPAGAGSPTPFCRYSHRTAPLVGARRKRHWIIGSSGWPIDQSQGRQPRL